MIATDPSFTRLAPFLDPSLGSALQVALLGIASGLHDSELAHLPGLANASRRSSALAELRRLGRIDHCGHAVPAHTPIPAELDRMLRSKKLRTAIKLVSVASPILRARGLEGLAQSLSGAEAAGLERLIRECDRLRPADVEFRRLRRQSRLAYVARRIPDDQAHAGAVLPDDLCHQTLALVAVDEDEVGVARMAERIQRLHAALVRYGREPLQRWWEVLTHFSEAGRAGGALYVEWLTRMQSYALRRRLRVPGGVWLASEWTSQEIKGRFPVPDCAYGPWVEDELRLYGRVISSLRRKVGYDIARAAWIGAHETLVQRGRPYADDDVRRETSPVARRLRAGVHPPTGPWAHLSDPIEPVEERRAIHQALQWAKAINPDLCLDTARGPEDVSVRVIQRRQVVAARFLCALARRESGHATEAGRIATLRDEILSLRVRRAYRLGWAKIPTSGVGGIDSPMPLEEVPRLSAA